MAPLMSRFFFVGSAFLSTATFALQIGEEVGDEGPAFVPGFGSYGPVADASEYGGVYGNAGWYAGSARPYGSGPAVHTVVHHPRPAQTVTHVYHSLSEEKHDMHEEDARAGEELADEQPGWGRGYGFGGYGYGGGYVRGGYGGYGPYGNAGFYGPAVETVVHHPRPAQAVTHVYHSLNEEKPEMPPAAGADFDDAESTDAPAPMESTEAPLDARASEEWGRGYGVAGHAYGGGAFVRGRGGYGGVGPYVNGVGPIAHGGFHGPAAAHTVVHHPRPAQAVTHVYHSLNEEKPKMPPAAGADFDDAESTDAPAPMESTEAPLDARASEEWGRGYGVAGHAYGGAGFVRGGRGYGGVGPYVNGVGPIAHGGFNGPAAAHTVVHHPRPAQAVTHVYHSRNEDDDDQDEE